MTAAELMAKLERDADFQRRTAEKERAREKRQNALDKAFRPFLASLQSLGLQGDSLHEIVKRNSPLPAVAVDVLLSSLAVLEDARLQESVVRALGAAARPFDGEPLIRCFELTDDEGLKWAVANTVALARPHSIDDWLEELCKSPYWSKTLRNLGYEH